MLLRKSVTPAGSQARGTELTYAVAFTNTGGASAMNLVIQDPIPADTYFKIGSATSSLRTTGLVTTLSYSNDGGSTWTYAPVSGGGGAPAGYDRNVTHIRWTFRGNLSHRAPSNTGSVSFTVRISRKRGRSLVPLNMFFHS